MKKFLGIIAVSAAASLTFFAINGCGPQKPKLYIYNWENYMPNSVIKEFEKKYGVKVVYDMFDSNEELYTKLRSGGGRYDIVVPSADYASIMISEGMVQEIDRNLVPNLKNIDSTMLEIQKRFDPQQKYSVPYAAGMAGVSVNIANVGEDFEKSWRIYENPAFKGKMTLLDDMREVMGGALKTLGYSVNSHNPQEVEDAKNLVLEWKKHIVKFDVEAFGKGFAAGDFWVVHGYAENVFIELNENNRKTARFFHPKEGGPMYMDNMLILKDAKNVELAHTFMNFIHEPEIYAQIMDYLETPSINVPARDHMEEETHYTIEDMAEFGELKEDLGEHLEMYNKAWQEIRVGR